MPDNDYVPSIVRGAWRSAFRAVSNDEPPAFVGRLLERASAAYLRANPCPGVGELVRHLGDCARANDSARFEQSVTRFFDQAGRSPLARVYAEQADVLYAVDRLTVATLSEAETLGVLGRAVLERVANAQLFDRALGDMASSEVNFDAQQRYRDACHEAADYETLADRQVAHLDSGGIRAPAHRRRATADMLSEEVV